MSDAPRELDLIDETAVEEAAAERAEAQRQAAVHLVNALFRLVRVLGIHSESNQAVSSLVDGMVAAVSGFCEVSGSAAASVLFAEDTVFVNGQMLKASRDTYATALRLGQYYERCGISEVTFERGVLPEQVSALARATHRALRGDGSARGLLDVSIGGVRLRKIVGSATAGEGCGEETLAERVVRTYATSVVVLRQFYAELGSGSLDPPRRIRRIAQKIVSSADDESRVLLALTGARAAEADPATLAVNTAILAVLMARGLTSDRAALAGIATAALLYDVGVPRLERRSAVRSEVRRRLSDEELDRLPASTAAVLTALSGIRTRAIASNVIGWEAHWLQRAARLGPPYSGRRGASLHARILSTARSFTGLMGAVGSAPPAVDDVIQVISERAADEGDRAVVRLLIAALGLFPIGATVELSTGELALVVGVHDVPLNYSRPTVRLLSDAAGNLLESGADVDLAEAPARGQPLRSIRRVVETDAQQLKEMRSYVMGIVAGRKMSPPVRQAPPPGPASAVSRESLAPRESGPSRESFTSRETLPPIRFSKPPPGAGRYSSVPSDEPSARRTSAATREATWEDYRIRGEETARPTEPPRERQSAPTRQVSWEDYPVSAEDLKRPTAPPSKPIPAPTTRVSWENYHEAFAAVQASRDPAASDDPRDTVEPVPPTKRPAQGTRMMRWANTEALFDDLEAEARAKRGGDGSKE